MQQKTLELKTTLNRLNLKQSFDLTELVRDEFVSSNMNDKEFAAYAQKKLGFDINSDHVKTRRAFFDIEPKNPRGNTKDIDALFDIICDLTARVKALEVSK